VIRDQRVAGTRSTDDAAWLNHSLISASLPITDHHEVALPITDH
jgi:hypothetical protein